MSKKNIIDTRQVGNATHVTFQTDSGPKTYAYVGSSARALARGTDPAQLAGRLVVGTRKKK